MKRWQPLISMFVGMILFFGSMAWAVAQPPAPNVRVVFGAEVVEIVDDPSAGPNRPLHFRLHSTAQEIVLTDGPRQTHVSLKSFAGKQLRLNLDQNRLRLDIQNQPLDLIVIYDPTTASITLTTVHALSITHIEATANITLNVLGDAANILSLNGPVNVKRTLLINSPGPVIVDDAIRAEDGLTVAAATFTLNRGGYIEVLSGSLDVSVEERLTLTEGQLRSGGDLHLRGERLHIRDSVSRPVIIQASQALHLHGQQAIDIVALAHPDSALKSGGEMILRSAHPVNGDSHYFAGGPFKIEQAVGRPGDLVSPHDPIILADGDVTLGDYSGASLHIVAGGSVLLNSATIIGTDTGANTINPGNGTLFNGTTPLSALAPVELSNGTPVSVDGSAAPTLDVRAGVEWAALGGSPGNQVIPPGSVPPTFAATTTAAITVTTGITVTEPEGRVLLTNQYQPNGLPGHIVVGDVDVRTVISGTNAGSITLDSRGNITTGNLNAAADVAGDGVTAGDGGAITLLASDGSLSGGSLASFSRVPVNSSGTAGNGGPILLNAAADITLDGGSGNVESFAFANSEGDAGNGGDITVQTTGGNIALGTLFAQSFAGTNGQAGDGGNVTVATDGGAVNISGGFFSSVQTFAQDFSNSAGDGGDVTMSATNGIIVTQGIDTRTPGNNSQAGDISLTTSAGNINTGFLRSFAANTSTPGSPGDVTVQTLDGGIVTGDIEAFASALVINNPAQNGGNIILEAFNGDVSSGHLWAYSEARGQLGDTGNGGAIRVTATNGSITGSGDLLAYARSAINNGNSSLAGKGGDITLQATQTISLTGRVESFSEAQVFSGEGGTAASGGDITMRATNGAIAIAGDVSAYASAKDDATNAGGITLIAANGIDLNGGTGNLKANVNSIDGSVGNGGDVRLETVNGDLNLNSVDAGASNTFGSGPAGQGGNISLTTANGHIQVGGNFFALRSEASTVETGGPAGDVILSATQGITISAPIRANGLGTMVDGGDVTLTTTAGNITTAEVLAQSVNNNNPVGSGGDVSLQALDGGITTGDVGTYALALFINNTTGDGGNIDLTAANGDAVTGRLEAYSEARGQFGHTGDGGRVEVTVPNGNIFIAGDIRTDAFSQDNNLRSGDAGSSRGISLRAMQEITVTGGLQSFARSSRFDGLPTPTGTAGNAGPVTLTATNISLSYIDARSVATGTIGSGGVVQIDAGQFFRGTGTIFGSADTISTVGLPNTGPITITHGGQGSIPFIVGDPATNGVTGTLTTGDATLSPTQSFFFDHFEPPNLWILSVPTPTIVINEIMKAPAAVTDENGEWLELYNAGQEPFDINNCVLRDNAGEMHLIASNSPLLMNPGDYLVLGRNGDPATNGGVAVAYAYDFYVLNDAADEVILACRGLEIDRVEYDDGLTFPDLTGASMQLLSPDVDNNDGANWCEAGVPWIGSAGDLGTPGTANTCPTDLTLSLTVTPPVVTPGQTLTYTLTYANLGPSLTDAVITDIIPAELTNPSFSSSGPTIIPTGGVTYVWQIPNLLPNSGGVISVTGLVDPTLPPDSVFTNTAQIVSLADGNQENDRVEVDTTVVAELPPPGLLYLPLLLKTEPSIEPLPPDLVVDSLVAAGNTITVVIKNSGEAVVSDAFWVDVYINPDSPPTAVNQEWYDVGTEGAAWGVVDAALPLDPDEMLTLTIGDAYYQPNLSNISLPLAVGTPVYAQVDSVNLLTTYGGVLESHEISGGPYNNITRTVSISGTAGVMSAAEAPSVAGDGLPAR